MGQRFYVETLGCPKNQVDSDKLIGTLLADGMSATDDPAAADLVVVNTCAFIDEARKESIDTILALEDQRKTGAQLVVTGCMAERYGARAGRSAARGRSGGRLRCAGEPRRAATGRALIAVSTVPIPTLDLLNLPRPKSAAPWAYVKIAEGCDRTCGFCAIPSFRGPQRSRDVASILAEVEQLEVAGDRAGRPGPRQLRQGPARRTRRRLHRSPGAGGQRHGAVDPPAVPVPERPHRRADRRHLDTGVPVLRPLAAARQQAVAAPHAPVGRRRAVPAAHRRHPRSASPTAAFRSNFIVGYPGETEEDHDQLLAFVEAAQLDWCGFFAYSPEDGTYAMELDGSRGPAPDARAARPSCARCRTTSPPPRSDDSSAQTLTVLVDEPGVARSTREAPEIDGIVEVPHRSPSEQFHEVRVVDAMGPDLVADSL